MQKVKILLFLASLWSVAIISQTVRFFNVTNVPVAAGIVNTKKRKFHSGRDPLGYVVEAYSYQDIALPPHASAADQYELGIAWTLVVAPTRKDFMDFVTPDVEANRDAIATFMVGTEGRNYYFVGPVAEHAPTARNQIVPVVLRIVEDVPEGVIVKKYGLTEVPFPLGQSKEDPIRRLDSLQEYKRESAAQEGSEKQGAGVKKDQKLTKPATIKQLGKENSVRGSQ